MNSIVYVMAVKNTDEDYINEFYVISDLKAFLISKTFKKLLADYGVEEYTYENYSTREPMQFSIIDKENPTEFYFKRVCGYKPGAKLFIASDANVGYIDYIFTSVEAVVEDVGEYLNNIEEEVDWNWNWYNLNTMKHYLHTINILEVPFEDYFNGKIRALCAEYDDIYCYFSNYNLFEFKQLDIE